MMQALSYIQLQKLLRWCLTTYHGRIVAVGLTAGLIYLPTYISILIDRTLGGSSTIILNAGFLYLGLECLWTHRQELMATQVLKDDRLIGYFLILGGALWIPFSLSSASMQAFLWMMILVGIAWSCFSPKIFGRFPLSSGFILLSMYPDYVWLSNRAFRALTGPHLLENLMAWLGGITLSLMGYAPEVQGRFISITHQGAVEVGPGCNGFDMAFVLAGVSFIWGLLTKKSWQQIAIATVVGITISFILNIPRIVLLTFASIYWGQESFDFWHGLWGGQIFATLMFTVYYYAAMAIYDLKNVAPKAN